MAGFLKKIFGGKKKNEAVQVIEEALQGVITKSNLALSFDVKEDDDRCTVELFGDDEENLKDKEGLLLDAFQLFVTRVIQHRLPESKLNVEFDCNGYRADASKELIELAEKLKTIAISKKKSVYFRALPPKDRKVIHQYLADDQRVKSRSIGDGLYKKIKIYPAGGGKANGKNKNSDTNTEAQQSS